ncbi:MAG: tripartite tricarboxylate transporter substrate binding protein [Limnohabitans sp.]|nr:tripartite tricarboxylate transporter substrate binding protein [Limnohabitans sp.]
MRLLAFHLQYQLTSQFKDEFLFGPCSTTSFITKRRLKMNLLKRMLTLVAALTLAMTALSQPASRYPTKAIDVVYPFAPGGAGDTWVRILVPYLSQKWGVPINVINRPGGSGVIGTMAVISAEPDGYTILFDGLNTPAVTAIQASAPFKWTDVTPIAKVTSSSLAFAVPADSPWKTLSQAIADIKKEPGAAKAGVGGAGSPATFALAKFFSSIGVDPVKVPRVIFDGSTPAMAALAGGHVHFTSQPLSDTLALAQAGKVRILAISARVRSPAVADIPTGLELGFPGYDLGTWGAFEGPPKLPAQVVQIWSDGLKEVLRNPEVIEKLKMRQSVADFLSPEDTRNFLEVEYNTRLEIAKRLGLRK